MSDMVLKTFWKYREWVIRLRWGQTHLLFAYLQKRTVLPFYVKTWKRQLRCGKSLSFKVFIAYLKRFFFYVLKKISATHNGFSFKYKWNPIFLQIFYKECINPFCARNDKDSLVLIRKSRSSLDIIHVLSLIFIFFCL